MEKNWSEEAAMSTNIFGPAYDAQFDRERVMTQMEVIRDVLLSAAECAEIAASFRLPNSLLASDLAPDDAGDDAAFMQSGWMTLRELSELTGYGEASISAQLRHLRKTKFGGYVVAKRRRGPAKSDGLWEYRIAGRTEQAQLLPLFAGARM
jgi:hypothetical protein